MLYRKKHVFLNSDGPTLCCVKFSRHHTDELKHSLEFPAWAATPHLAADKAGPTFPLCGGIRMGLLIQKGEERKIKDGW